LMYPSQISHMTKVAFCWAFCICPGFRIDAAGTPALAAVLEPDPRGRGVMEILGVSGLFDLFNELDLSC
jgi:hypothetical protein